MNQKKFVIGEAVQFVLEPRSESELSELEESDFMENTDITTEVLPWICEVEQEIVGEETEEEEDEEVIINNEQNAVFLELENGHKNKVKNRKIPQHYIPLNYFQFFWKDFLHEVLAEQTNLYSMQKTGNTNKKEIKQFIGIQIYITIIALSAYFMCWSQKTRYQPISDLKSINKYRVLRQLFHVADYSQKDNLENKNILPF